MLARSATIAALAALAFAGMSLADDLRGVIKAVDPAKKQVALEVRSRPARGQTMTFTLGPETRILVRYEPARLEDLKPGEKARVYFETRDGKQVVRRISAHGPRKTAEPAATVGSENEVSGILRRVAYTEREIVVIGPGARGAQTETVLQVLDNVRVTRDQKEIKFDDLKEGEKVVVRSEKKDGKLAAAVIAAR